MVFILVVFPRTLRNDYIQGVGEDADIEFSAGREPVSVSVSRSSYRTRNLDVTTTIAMYVAVFIQSPGHQQGSKDRHFNDAESVYCCNVKDSVADVCKRGYPGIVAPLTGVAYC